MKRNKWMAIFLCFALLLCTGCGTGQQGETTTAMTTQQDFSIPDDFPTQSGELPGRETPYPTVKIPTSPDDPYAQIVKDLYEQSAQYVTAEEIFEDFKYALCDIDGDGTQELLLSTWYFKWGIIDHEFHINDENYWKDKEGLVLDTFYTIKNGEAEEVVDPMDANWDYFAESMGGREILTNGIIRLCGGSPDYTSYAYYVYKDGVLTFLKALRYYADETRWLITFEGDQSTRTKITEAEFNRLRAEIEGDAQVVEIDWKPLESYGRE